ncbi:efflux transporter outer membrane subunit [Paucibacter sp. PLA-PC-4]|uniref:efflux transporter outer membrane subunit n=1 Tax=Paucibacter sp. PLA-PC-4 TaxID=2993655 RepID=UPI002248FCB3|nr:efflux transporter outer membrane subunit [Paucibacter sp. PLA-PC-4]MCX2860901.1 efflux transporter outer membrane subunit [Paucibacter sp. PLA-PC-4]
MALFRSRWPILALSALVGCANLAPTYTRPDLAVPASRQSPVQAPAKDAAELSWRTFFDDQRLLRSVELALANNRDLRVAALNVERARAQYRITDAARLPTVNAGVSASRSDNGSSLSASLSLAGYELDLFGRVKNLSESALQSYLATAESRRSVQISLVAEVANAWLTLSADLERQRLARQTLETRQRGLALNQRMHELGAITGLALTQAQTAVDSARVDIANYATLIEQDRNALNLLLGAALPDELLPRGDEGGAAISLLVELPAGVPSSVLQRRPDVRAAEHQLQASHSDIGVARAERFPRISLTASAGSASRELSGLFKSGSGSWSFGPSLSLPIFDGGASRTAVQVAELNRQVALAEYDKSVQTAFREVADALAVRATLGERLAAQTSLNAGAERQLRLAEAQFRAGSTTQLEVLDAQRSLYSSQQALIALRLAEQSNRITLYKVLGGGWKDEN